MSHPDAEFLEKYLDPLVGARIERVSVEVEDEEGYAQAWPVLHVIDKSGVAHKLEISQDEEGNGPGFIFGLPFPGGVTR